MKIESLKIISFGGIRELTLEFSGNMTVVEGANESGKSTVAAFIKFMLYGFNEKSEKALRTPWDSSSSEGSMIIRSGGERYRIGRCSRDGRDECQIIELSGNTQCYKGKQPGEIFLGVDADVFDHSAYVNQIGGGRINGEVMAEAIGNILYSADETLGVQRAQKRLDEERVRLWHKNKRGGRIYELECRREELLERRKAASSDIAAVISKDGQLTDLKSKMSENSAKLKKISRILSAYSLRRRTEQQQLIAELQKRSEDLKTQRKELDARYRADNGYLPDEGFETELSSLWAGLDYIDRRISELGAQNAEINMLEPEKPPQSVVLLRKHGGYDALISKFEEYRIRRRALIAFGIVFGLLFIPAAVIAVSLMLLNYTYGSVASLGALSLMFGMIMCLVSSGRYTKSIDNILDEFSAAKISDFKRIISEAAEFTEPDRRESSAMLIEGEQVRLKAQRESKLAELNNLTKCWGGRSFEHALSDLSEYNAAVNALNVELEKSEAELLGATSQKSDEEGVGADPSLIELAARLPHDIDIGAMKREHDFFSKANESMAARAHELEIELSALNAKTDTPANIADRITALDYELANLRSRFKAVELASITLQNAAANMRETLSPRLSEFAGQMMSSFSGGKYKSIAVDNDLSLSYDADAGAMTRHGIEYMSAGTQDIAYLSLRLALINLLFRNGKPPLIFDESFTRLDNDRLRNVLQLLESASESGTQVIIFTAQPREYAALALSAKQIKI